VTLDVQTLSKLDKKPYIDQITLELLRQFYEEFLEPYVFIFELENGVSVNLDFHKESFCHLVGIEKLARNVVSKKDRHKYVGVNGYENIKNGTITLKELRDAAKKRINLIKDKLVFFYLIPQIIESPTILLDFITAPDGSNIEAQFIAYSSTEEVYIHLAIDEDEKTGRHFPRSFFAERINESNDGTKFIKGQTPLKVVSTKKVKQGEAVPTADAG
jgi:hypothetical protein